MKIKTKRLLIRELLPENWQDMQRIALDFAQSEYIIFDRPLPVDDSGIRALTKKFADTHLFFAVFLQDTMIGYVCFYNSNGNYDIGYCFHSDYHGKGYAFESCSALMLYMEQECSAEGFTAGTALKNTPSCRLLERLGFTLKETETLSFNKDESGSDIVFEGGIFVR